MELKIIEVLLDDMTNTHEGLQELEEFINNSEISADVRCGIIATLDDIAENTVATVLGVLFALPSLAFEQFGELLD